jgi:methyl-accepting chemotaxis protein
MKLSSAKISSRINLLASMSILVAALLSFSYFYGDHMISRDFQKQSEFGHLAKLVQEVEIQALTMRRNEKEFLLRKDAKYIKGYDTAEKAIFHALEEASGLSVSKTVSANIKSLEQGVERHKDIFHNITKLQKKLGFDEKQGFRGQLQKAAGEVEGILKSTTHDGLMTRMLRMRSDEKDFKLQGNKKYIASISKKRSDFDDMLAGTFFSKEKKAKFGTLMDAYQKNFNDFANATLTLKPEMKKLSLIFTSLNADFDAIHKVSEEGVHNTKSSLMADRVFTKKLFLGSAVVALIFALGLAMLIGRSIVMPLRKMTAAMQKLAEGDVSVEIPNRHDQNQIGYMAQAVEVFQKHAIQKLKDEEQSEHAQREKNEKRQAMDAATSDFTITIGSIVEKLTSVSSEQNETASSMADISEKTSAQASSVSTASEQASANVQAVATAAEEMTSTIAEISQQVGQASNASRQAVEEVENTSVQMTNLSETANKIGAVVELISSIAEQTNLLALNATIESARAGEAGKGFAVVAGEVKQLASQTAKATAEISQQISDIQGASSRASASMGNVAQAIRNVDEISTAIAAAMEEQGAATQEIAGNVHQAAAGTQQVNESIVSVTHASQEAGVASERVLTTADELSSQVQVLKSEVGLFLEKVQAG